MATPLPPHSHQKLCGILSHKSLVFPTLRKNAFNNREPTIHLGKYVHLGEQCKFRLTALLFITRQMLEFDTNITSR